MKYRISKTSRVLGIRLLLDDYKKLTSAADANNITVSQLVKKLIKKFIKTLK